MDAVCSLRPSARVPYAPALRWQHDTAARVRDGAPEALALLEHEPVYTMGARGGRANLLAPPGALRAPLVDVDRGGDVTWHGPGQLTAYPILHLRLRGLRAADYVRRLEAVLVDTLLAFGVHGVATPGRPGVWVGTDKVAAIGVSIHGGVSMHGVALNVLSDLAWFDAIVPCGIRGAGVTSLARLGVGATLEEARSAFAAAFERGFGCALVESDPAPLFEAVAS